MLRDILPLQGGDEYLKRQLLTRRFLFFDFRPFTNLSRTAPTLGIICLVPFAEPLAVSHPVRLRDSFVLCGSTGTALEDIWGIQINHANPRAPLLQPLPNQV